MIQFAWPWMFLLLPAPFLYRWLMPAMTEREAALRMPFYRALRQHRSSVYKTPLYPLIFFSVVWLLLVSASARPQQLGEVVNVPVSGRDLMLAVDISGSMKAQDMSINQQKYSRLAAVKYVASEFIERRLGDRLGLILFGTQAYLQTPLSLDRNTVTTLLQEATIGIAGEKTAIGDAIGLAVKRFQSRKESNRVLILLTDGSNTAGVVEPIRAAELASTVGVKIYTIGIGARKRSVGTIFGSQITAPAGELDEGTLQSIAQKTGGNYYRAENIESLEEIYRLIDRLEPIVRDTSNLRPSKDLFHWPLAVATLLLMITGFARIFHHFGVQRASEHITGKLDAG
ncbi:MAG: VWA domain-containing protein [Pseudomonadota bacterium]